MKVLLIPEYGEFGGTLTFLKRLLAIHEKNNIETAVLIHKNQHIPHVLQLFKEHGLRLYSGPNRHRIFWSPVLSPLFDLLFSWNSVCDFQPDIVVVSNGTPGVMTGVLAYRRPVLFFMHTYPQAKFPLLARVYLKFVGSLRNKFVTVSRFSAAAISRCMGVSSDEVEVIYNSCPSATDSQQKKNMVLTVGYVDWYKNPEVWLKVAELTVATRDDVQFVWLGDGILLEPMRQKVKALGLEKHVSFEGFCSNVSEYFSKAEIYFQPSLLESHGISVVQAMANGLPCVASSAGGLPESVTDGENGYTRAPDDYDGFVACLTALIDDADLRRKMGKAGRDKAQRLFSEREQEAKIVDLYRKAVGQKS